MSAGLWDAVVVGARCAGAPTAMHLARRGRRVLLVDRATFPSETISTHYLSQSAVRSAVGWGLLPAIEALGAPPIAKLSSDWGDFPLTGRPPPMAGVPGGFAPRRSVLDAMLLGHAVEAGAELREGVALVGLVRDGNRVVGAKLSAGGGTPYVEHARAIVGADGRNSAVARLAGAEIYEGTPPLACQWYAYWSGVPTDGLENYRVGRAMLFAIPSDAGLTCVVTAMPRDRFDAFRRDLEASYMALLDETPLGERVRAGRREGKIVGTGDLPNFLRRAAGPGWALVGDAGSNKDPLTAQGIRDAFRDAERLASAIDCADEDPNALDAALTTYWQERDALMREMFEHTCKVARLSEPTAADFKFRRLLAESQEDVDRFYGVGDGTVSPSEFEASPFVRRCRELSRA
jgi:2-polyprenyl-6-methoxyphenol hydroxylase-like FAD-dependent oxidoreductase